MPLVVTDAAERSALETWLRVEQDERPANLGLFTNNYVPVAGSTLAALTEATFLGYALKVLAPEVWTTPVTQAGRAVSQYGEVAQSWTNTGEETQRVYGYFILSFDGTLLVWLERWAAFVDVAPGGTISVLPVLTARSEF